MKEFNLLWLITGWRWHHPDGRDDSVDIVFLEYLGDTINIGVIDSEDGDAELRLQGRVGLQLS